MTTTVKVLNAEKVIGTHQIPKDNVLVLKAENNVNYQLVNDATGFGPQNILTKREGNNLVISLEDGDTRPDLIIEDYYSNKGATNLIVGLHENGQIYAYVPESGKVAESISVLAEEVVAPQALGGTELAVPFWSFNPWWLAGAAAVVGGVAALAAGGSSKKASVATTTAPKLQASENGDLEVLPADGNRTVTVDFLNKQGQQQVIKIERVGNEWRIVEPADTTLPNYVQFDSTTGKITIDPSEVGGDGKVNVSATEPGKIDSSQKDVTNNTQLTAEKPDVEPTGNGGKTVSPKNNTKEMSINFTNEQGQPQTVVVEKVNGVWQPKNGGALPKGVDLNDQTGQVTLDPQLLGDRTPISVEGKEDGKVDAVVNGVTDGDQNAAPPPVRALADGGVEFSPAVGNTEVYAEFFNEDNVKQTVTIVQDTNGNWVLKPGTTKPEGVTINSNGVVTVDSQAIQDKSKITAIGREAGKNEAPNDATSSAVDTAPAQPKVLPKESGGIDIIPAAGNDEVAVEIPNEKGGIDPISIKKVGNDWLPVVNGNTLPKSENGNYAELPKGITVDPKTGKISVDPQAVADNAEITATATENGKTGVAQKTASTIDDKNAAQPKVEAKADGSVVATPETGNELMEVKYHSEGNTGTAPDQKVTVAKGDDGWYFALPPANPTDKPTLLFKDGDTWKVKSPDGQTTDATPEQINALPADVKDGDAKLDKATGAVTLDPQAVKDGSKVEATGKEAGKVDSPELDPAPVTKADGTAGEPTVVTDPTGPVSATPNMTNDLMEVKYHSEDNTGTEPNKTVTVKKVGNDWVPVVDGQTLPKSDTGVYTELPNVKVDPVTGKVTLDKDLVKDGTEVTVTVTEGRKDPVTKTDNSGYDEVPQPDIVANADNGFDVTPKPQNVEMTASFTNERDQPQEVKIKKEGDEWFFPVEVTSNKDDATGSEPALLFKNKDGQWMAKGTGGQPDKPATSAQIAALPQEVRDGNVTLEQSSGKLSIGGQAIKDDTKVSVTAKDAADRTSTPKESDNPAPNDGTAASPNITTTENGGVKVKPAANSKELEVKFHSENNPDGAQPNQTVTAVLDETTGKWKPKDGTKLPKGVTLNSTTGEIELKPHAVKDKSEVTATATEPAPTKPASVTGIAPEDTGPASTESATEADPTKNIKPGDTVIRPADDTKTIDVTYVNKDGETKKVQVTKNGNGTWSKSGDTDADGLKFDPTDGTLVIPTEKLKGGSEVTYVTYTDTVPEDKYTRKTPAALQVEQADSGTNKGGLDVYASKDDTRIEVEMTSEADNQYTMVFTRTNDASNDWKLERIMKSGESAPVYTHNGSNPMPVDLQRWVFTRDANGVDSKNKVNSFEISNDGHIEFHSNALKDGSRMKVTGYTKDNIKEFERESVSTEDFIPPGAGFFQDKGTHYEFNVLGQFWAAEADQSMPITQYYKRGAIDRGNFINSSALVIQYTDTLGVEHTKYVVRPSNQAQNGAVRGLFTAEAVVYERESDGSWREDSRITPTSGGFKENQSPFISLGQDVKAYIRKSDIQDGSLKLFMDTGYDTKDIPEIKLASVPTHNIGSSDIRINGEKLLGAQSISNGSAIVKLDGTAGTDVIFEVAREGAGYSQPSESSLQIPGYTLHTYLDQSVNQNLFVYVQNGLDARTEII